jgi:hypothetical protein
MQIEGKKIDFDAPISDTFHVENHYKGEVGIEVEVEGHSLPHAIPSYWHAKKDGSLRGADNCEYVLKQPCQRKSVLKFLQYLEAQLVKSKAKVDESKRTSVHVHVNMNTKSLVDCYTLVVLYYLFEDAMTRIAGDSRVGNLFCLRASDAEYIVDVLAKSARGRKFNLNPEQLRYTSVNVCAIQTFNSIEFRALRGTTDPHVISEWVELLLSLKDAASKYTDPAELMGDFSRLGPEQLTEEVFGKRAGLILKQKGYAERMWDAARLVQEIAFATDWKKQVKPKRMFEVAGGAARRGVDDED